MTNHVELQKKTVLIKAIVMPQTIARYGGPEDGMMFDPTKADNVHFQCVDYHMMTNTLDTPIALSVHGPIANEFEWGKKYKLTLEPVDD